MTAFQKELKRRVIRFIHKGVAQLVQELPQCFFVFGGDLKTHQNASVVRALVSVVK